MIKVEHILIAAKYIPLHSLVWPTQQIFPWLLPIPRLLIDISVYTYRVPSCDKIAAWLYYIMGVLDFHSILITKILFAVRLKHSSFWPSADVKSMSKDVVHVFSLYVYENYYLWGYQVKRFIASARGWGKRRIRDAWRQKVVEKTD